MRAIRSPECRIQAAVPSRIPTLKAVRGEPGVYRCSICKAQFGGSAVTRQFVEHLRSEHQPAKAASAKNTNALETFNSRPRKRGAD
jgi:hypothetical protein